MMAELYEAVYNPDVLSCLANLSSDEVFTPPAVANAMLDMLPQELFTDPNTTFLDPACKSGVFLREIAKRLITGLEPIYPDLESRLDHIFREQLFGIAITELTSMISRRSLYCSAYPNSDFSILMQMLASMNMSKSTYCFVPVQDFSKTWTDEELYAKYGLTQDEIDFIDSMIKPMDSGGDDDA